MKMKNHDVNGNNNLTHYHPPLKNSSQPCMSGVWGETLSRVSLFVLLPPFLVTLSSFSLLARSLLFLLALSSFVPSQNFHSCCFFQHLKSLESHLYSCSLALTLSLSSSFCCSLSLISSSFFSFNSLSCLAFSHISFSVLLAFSRSFLFVALVWLRDFA